MILPSGCTSISSIFPSALALNELSLIPVEVIRTIYPGEVPESAAKFQPIKIFPSSSTFIVLTIALAFGLNVASSNPV